MPDKDTLIAQFKAQIDDLLTNTPIQIDEQLKDLRAKVMALEATDPTPDQQAILTELGF